ncbi:MAG: hypothetical protein J6O13_03770 [Selenomonas sp.]|nr:hypothetical protein [Selenomonas sp.]
MKKKSYSQVFAVMLLLATLFTSGCGPEARLGGMMLRDVINGDSPFWEDDGITWHTLKIKQGDGKTFSMDLPFDPGTPKTYPDEGNKKNEELYEYKDKGELFLLNHADITNTKGELRFTKDFFSEYISGVDIVSVVKEENRRFHGQKGKYMKLRAQNSKTNRPYWIECVGIHAGTGYWVIIYSHEFQTMQEREKTDKKIDKVLSSISI